MAAVPGVCAMTTLGQRAYRLFVEHRSWIAVAREVYGNDDRDHQQKARAVAKSYARGVRKPWPVQGADVGPIEPRARRGPLHGADLTRNSIDLAREYNVSLSAISKARARAGLTEWTDARTTAPTVPVPLPREPKAPRPGKVRVVAPASVVHVLAPVVAEPDLVEAIKEELAVCRSAYSAALMVSSRLNRPMDELLPVVERLMGRAA